MNDLFYLLYLSFIDNLFNYLLNRYDSRNFYHSLDYLFDILRNFHYLVINVANLQNLIDVDRISQLIMDHSQNCSVNAHLKSRF